MRVKGRRAEAMGCALASCPVVRCNVIKGGKAGAEQKRNILFIWCCTNISPVKHAKDIDRQGGPTSHGKSGVAPDGATS